MGADREDPALGWVRRRLGRQERQLEAIERVQAVRAFRESFDSYIETFLERRRESQRNLTGERRDEVRAEYGTLRRGVVGTYRPLRDLFRTFVTEEPEYDRRHEMFENGGHELPLDFPLTDWWGALTLDEALAKWSNADDDHIGHYLARQRAVLDGFDDWAGVVASEQSEPEPARDLAPAQTPPGPGLLARAVNNSWIVTIVGGTIVVVIGVLLTIWLT